MREGGDLEGRREGLGDEGGGEGHREEFIIILRNLMNVGVDNCSKKVYDVTGDGGRY